MYSNNKKAEKICGTIALLAPLWMAIIEQLNRKIHLSAEIHVVLCVSTAVMCWIALGVSIILGVLEMRKEKVAVSKRNRKLIFYASSIGIILLTIIIAVML